jgi:hypothetical protein
MPENVKLKPEQLSQALEKISSEVMAVAQTAEGDNVALLALLRLLEQLHREICEGVFQDALPDNRQSLYALLKDIETKGGWPYIYRLKLQSFLVNLAAEADQGAHEDDQ